MNHRDDEAAVVLPLRNRRFSSAMLSAWSTLAMPSDARFLKHLVFELVAIDHQHDVGFFASVALKSSSAALIIV